MADVGHVLAVFAHRLATFASDFSHVLAVPADRFTTFTSNLTPLFRCKIVAAASVFATGLRCCRVSGTGVAPLSVAADLRLLATRVFRLRALHFVCLWHDRSFALGF